MRKKITYYLKNSNLFSELYFVIGTILVNILRFFVKADDKLVLFVSYGGKQISDSPYALFEKMKNDPFFEDWKLVWAVVNPEKYEKNFEIVKIDSYQYFKTCLTARIWITNSGIKRYLSFSGKRNLFVNTWHGIPLKNIGVDELGVKKSKVFARKWYEFSKADMNLYHSDYDLKILSHVFNAPKNTFYKFGLPRNDRLYSLKNDVNFRMKIREKLGIPEDKKVILYAPTVRGEQVSKEKDNVFTNPFNLKKWQLELQEYIVLFRAHYFVTDRSNTKYANVIDVTEYPSIDDLYLASDMVVSDYSSVFFDYSILERPMFCYAYDLDQYKKYQGLYLNPKDVLPHFAEDEDSLINLIQEFGNLKIDPRTQDFKQKFVPKQTGDSASQVIAELKRQLK